MLLEQLAEKKHILKADQLCNLAHAELGVAEHLTGGVDTQLNDILIRRNLHQTLEKDVEAGNAEKFHCCQFRHVQL